MELKKLTMKKKSVVSVLLASCLLLSACGANTAPEARMPDAPLDTAAAPENENRSDVENNGGHYVRVGDKVYFRRYGADAFETIAAFGEFTDSTKGKESEIVAYDPERDTLETVAVDTGFGPLWYGDGGFYLQELINWESRVVWYSLDGSETRDLGCGTMLGVSDDGLVAVETLSYGSGSVTSTYHFYRDLEPAGEMALESEYGYECAGMTNDGLFLLKADYNEDGGVMASVWQAKPDGTVLSLGDLPETGETLIYSPEIDQFVASEEAVGVVVGYYAGTGHFLNEAVAVRAVPGQEDSLRVFEEFVISEGDDEPKLFVDESGELTMTDWLQNELRVNWSGNDPHDLQRRDGGNWVTLREELVPDMDSGSGYNRVVQDMDYVDGTAYVTLACVQRRPAEDIGWREMYQLLDMLYIAIPEDGEERELACVEHDPELYGNVWFIEGESCALYQQFPDEANDYYLPPYACAVPIAEDAEWDGGREAVQSDAAILTGDYGEADYNGYPAPEAETAAILMRLNRDGEATYLAQRAPDTLLSIEIGVDEVALSGAKQKLDIERRASDEDIPWYWAKLTALDDDVRVCVERTPDDPETLEEIAMQDGAFFPESTLCDTVLRRGEFIALRVSLPWHPELRVSASRDGLWGSYVFGEDNYLHYDEPSETVREYTLSGTEYTMPATEDELINKLSGTWICESAVDETVALFHFGGEESDGALNLEIPENTFELQYSFDRAYVDEYEIPDLLRLSTSDPATADRLGFGSDGVGDYLIDLYQTDGQLLLHLTQWNNGEGALTWLIPGANESQQFDFTLVRYEGAAQPAARRRGVTIPMVVVRGDAGGPNGSEWLREAEIVDTNESDDPVYRPIANAPCLPYQLSLPETILPLRGARDPGCPMEVFDVELDQDGKIIMLGW